MEPLGRKSGDSFKSRSSYRQSHRGRSYKKRLEQETTKTHTAEKVRKHKVRKKNHYWWNCYFFPCVLGVVWIRRFFACMLSCIHVLQIILFLCICVCVCLFFTSPESVYHEWIIEHLWAWTGFQLSHRCHSPPASSYQEAKPESDQWDFRGKGGERQHQW